MDPIAFPDPLEIKLDRPESSYVNYGWGPHICLGQEINIVANTAILRCLARLPNLRPAPGPQGQLKYVLKNNVVKVFLQEDWGNYWFFPTSMSCSTGSFIPTITTAYTFWKTWSCWRRLPSLCGLPQVHGASSTAVCWQQWGFIP